jgi:hypothetical protein
MDTDLIMLATNSRILCLMVTNVFLIVPDVSMEKIIIRASATADKFRGNKTYFLII